MADSEPTHNECQALMDFLHQTCVFMGIQDLDGEEYNEVFKSVRYRAYRDEDAAHKLAEAARRSSKVAKYLESAYKNMRPPPISATEIRHWYISTYKKYAAFAELRYQKALKKQFKGPNQILLIIRYYGFNRALRRAAKGLIELSGRLEVSDVVITNWMKEGRNTDLDALISR